jgi:hypothetical protein
MTATYDTELTRLQNFQRNVGVNVPDHVNPDTEHLYVASAVQKITTNWVRGNRTRWFAAHADAQRLRDWLLTEGEFAGTWDDNGNLRSHPLAIRGNGGFLDLLRKLSADLRDCGGLSDKQTDIVRKALANQERFAAERKAKFAAADASSQHVGTVGVREVFEVTVQWCKYFEGAFGATYIHGLKDAAGNVIIYKGSKCLGQKGYAAKIKATVKEHGERDGVKQTIITRPAAV